MVLDLNKNNKIIITTFSIKKLDDIIYEEDICFSSVIIKNNELNDLIVLLMENHQNLQVLFLT